MLTIRLLDAIDICYKWKLVLKKNAKKKSNFISSDFVLLLMSYLNVYPHQKCKKKTTFMLQFVLG